MFLLQSTILYAYLPSYALANPSLSINNLFGVLFGVSFACGIGFYLVIELPGKYILKNLWEMVMVAKSKVDVKKEKKD